MFTITYAGCAERRVRGPAPATPRGKQYVMRRWARAGLTPAVVKRMSFGEYMAALYGPRWRHRLR